MRIVGLISPETIVPEVMARMVILALSLALLAGAQGAVRPTSQSITGDTLPTLSLEAAQVRVMATLDVLTSTLAWGDL